MSPLELLSELRARDIRLWCEGDKLRYDAPEGAFSDELRAAVVRHKPELVRLLARESQRRAELPLRAIDRDGPLPLSSGQERLWFLDRLEPGSLAYNVPATVRLRGPLRPDVLERCLVEIARRHETLRSTFDDVDGRPRVVVADEPVVELEVEELSASAEPLEEARTRALEDAGRVFDLVRGPLLRTRLFRLGDDDWVLHVGMHHIVSDGWSMGVFFRELARLYPAFLAGEPSPLTPLEVQYVDVAAWQRERLASRGLEESLEFWRRNLERAPTLALPTDRPRPPAPTHAGGVVWRELSPELAGELRATAQGEDASLFQLLLTAFAVLLARTARQEDLVIGTPVAGRGERRTEDLIGFFVNNLVLRVDAAGEPTFRELLARVRAHVLAAFEHQDVPFDVLVDELAPARDLSRNPLFQVLFNHFNLSSFEYRLPPLELTTVDVTLDVAKFDLTLHCYEVGERLVAKVEYATDLFDASTAERLAAQYEHLLRAVAARPERPIHELELHGADARQGLLELARGPAGAVREDVWTLVRRAADASPDAPAVVCGEARLGYAELVEGAEGLAAELVRRGVRAEERVALCFESSVEMIVALLGVLRAGAAYVPLDPAYPEARLAFVLEDSGATHVVTHAEARAVLPASDAAIVELDAAGRPVAPAGRERPELPEPGAEQLAYVLYTSGTTGRPKGVEVERGNLASYVAGVRERLQVDAGARWAMVSTLAADLGSTMLWGALTTGGALHVVPHDVARDGDAFAERSTAAGFACLKIVPSHLRALMAAAADPAAVLPEELLVLGGEACTWELVDAIRATGARCRIVNHYGPTETTVGVTTHEVVDGDRERFPHAPPIGRPLAGVTVHLLDARGEPVPIGAVGEVCVTGPSVARGYLGRPDETARAFPGDPHAATAAARMYRTGDLARRSAGGELLFVGRADAQVGFRGHRVELGEIEGVLARHPRVASAAARLWSGGDRGERLAAYVVLHGEASEDVLEELRAQLRRELPSPIVPGTLTLLASLPVTPNGKLDRAALPEPGAAAPSGDAHVEPEGEAERTLAAIWAETLRVERVGATDDYFALGGESILSIQIVSRANRAGLRITPRQVFEHPTVRGLAAVAERARSTVAEQGAVHGPVPLTPVQRRFFELEPPQAHHYNHAFLFRAREPLDSNALERAVARLCAHHDALRLRARRAPSGWEQWIDEEQAATPFERVELGGTTADERRAELEARSSAAQASLDLEHGPILRVVQFALGGDEPDRVLLVLHHLAVDGVSWRILLEDLEAAYRAFARGQQPELPPKTSSFRAWAERLVERARSAELASSARTWIDALAGGATALPADRRLEPEHRTAQGVRVLSAELDAEATRRLLRDLPARRRARVDEALLAALADALRPWTGAESIVVDVEGHGREELFEDLDLTRTVGWFTAVHPVRLDAPEGDWPEATLRRTRETLRAVEHGGVDWGCLRYLAGGNGSREALLRLPAAEIGFNYLGRLDEIASDAGLFAPAEESAGAPVGALNRRRYALDVNAAVVGGRLRIDWVYDERAHDEATVRALADRHAARLEELGALATSEAPRALDVADFPAARLDEGALRVIEHRFGAARIEDVYVATPLQQGMLFRTIAEPESSAYVTQLRFTLRGTLEPRGLRRAWERALRRHSVLRTGFAVEGVREMHQVVLRDVELPWDEVDLRGIAGAERERASDERAAAERARPFELARPPLLRIVVLRHEDDRHEVLWTHHHALLDGWSLPLLLNEVFRGYVDERTGRPPRDELTAPFSDFVRWREGLDLEPARAAWRERLAGREEPTPLPFARGATAGAGSASATARLALEVSEEESVRLGAFARASGVTLNTLVQGAWGLLLARFARTDDVVFGVTVAGRPPELPGVESMLGLFLGTLPLRLSVGDDDVRSFLRDVQTRGLELQQNQHVPLFELRRAAGTESALFESLVVFENFPESDFEADAAFRAELSIEAPADVSHVDYPLALVVRPGRRLHLELRYDPAVFEPEDVARIGEHLATLLRGFAARPDAKLAELELAGAEALARDVAAWNATSRPYPNDQNVAALFAKRAEQATDAIAFELDGVETSYGALLAGARRLAGRLRERGVGPGDPVAVCTERSVEFVESMLAVLWCGGAYLPLDPELPEARVASILEDARPSVVVGPASATVPAGFELVDWSDRAPEGESSECEPRAGSDAAYVIYTSGSTGVPKGVTVPHRAIARLVLGTDYVQLGPEDRVAHAAHGAFDATTFEVWGALLNGARIVAVPRRVALAARDFARLLREREVSVLFVTTALFNQLSRAIPDVFASLRVLLFGGEAVDPDRVRAVLAEGAPARLLHVYGPTENTTFSTWHEVREVPAGATTVPIGRPVANSTAYVLDVHRRLAAVGALGELHVGGDGLALGYLGDAERTAQAFVPSPLGTGERLYATGDLVRQRNDGALEFVGRADQQVKLRGFRIELGEIEAALAELDGVAAAVAICRQDEGAGKQLVAYVVRDDGRAVDSAAVVDALRARLPAPMLPSAVVALDAIPLNANGKVDRAALPAPERVGREGPRARNEVEEAIAALWAEVLELDEVAVDANFFDLGGHSLSLLAVHQLLLERDVADVSVTDLFEHTTVEALARFVAGRRSGTDYRAAVEARSAGAERERDSRIAIVGMTGRFPGAANPEELWANLRAGVESVRFFDDDELRAEGVPEELLANPHYVRAKATIDGVELFDAGLFGYGAREAELLDPQQRLFLECAWEVLERAGHDPTRFDGLVSVHAGTSMSTYVENLRTHPELLASFGGVQGLLAADKDYLATRVSYDLDLRGPSMTVQTACSTGLVAVHEACRALADGRADLALAGGVSITVPVKSGYVYERGGIRSPDGHNRTFDARAAGTVTGSGVAILALRRLDDALRDGDPVHAVIRGIAVNNDGHSKAGFTAPSVTGQARVIAAAHAAAGVDPATISYVEAHGTATALGDPIEVRALTEVFRERTDERAFCAIGSLKSNMGHLNEAAGAAGLIKTALALEHAELPPSLHFERPNPEIDFAAGPFVVNDRLRPWEPRGGAPRRAGVSSFGLGGTNVHAVVEEAPERPASSPAAGPQVLALSAATADALRDAKERLAEHLRAEPGANLADVAFTLQRGRRELAHRFACVVSDVDGAIAALEGRAAEGASGGVAGSAEVALLFPGHGHQHVAMGRGLYRSEPVFREVVDRCREALLAEGGVDLLDVLAPEASSAEAEELLARASVVQPALFAVEVALGRLLTAWGVRVEACLGHSVGEFAAACVAGVLSLEEGLRAVAARGRCVEAAGPGAMLAVLAGEDEVRALLDGGPECTVATINAPRMRVLSGAPEAIDALECRAAERGLAARRVASRYAYHSPAMDGPAEALERALAERSFAPPRRRLLDSVRADWMSPEDATSPRRWAAQLREPVRFGDALEVLLRDTAGALLECGPGHVLASIARAHPALPGDRGVVPAMRAPGRDDVDDREALLRALAELWTRGATVDWLRLHAGEARRCVALPTYPFQRRRYWIERSRESADATPRRSDVADWFWARAWRRDPCARRGSAGGESWAVVGRDALADALAQCARGAGHDVARVERLDPDAPTPARIVLFAGLDAGSAGDWADDEAVRGGVDRAFFEGFELLRSLAESPIGQDVELVLVTAGVHDVLGEETVRPERATALGLVRVVQTELPRVRCRLVDLDPREVAERGAALAEELAGEVGRDAREPVVALRRGRRWVESFAAAPRDSDGGSVLRDGGTYVVTGGLTGVGLVLARAIASSVEAPNLVLVGRTQLPDRGAWASFAAERDPGDPVVRRIDGVRELEALGARVMTGAVDVSDRAALRSVLDEARTRFGPIHGCLHAAALPAGGLLRVVEPERVRDSLAAKFDGARVLADALRDDPLDFGVLCSSLNAVRGGPGLADYCAANAALDALATRLAAETGRGWVSVAWTRWREVGMAAEAAGQPLPADQGISNAEGAAVLDRVLRGPLDPHVLVCEYDLSRFLRAGADAARLAGDEETDAPSGGRASEVRAHERPNLAVDFVAPETEMEVVLAEIWCEVLGLDRVGVHDGFLELGGSSLTMVRVSTALEERTGLAVDLKALYHQTLGQLAATVTQQVGAREPERKSGLVKGILSRLGKIVAPPDESG